LPPIGFNKAAVKIEIEKFPGATAEAIFEVPAIVVVDPGHGGVPRNAEEEKRWAEKEGSSANNASCPLPPNGSGLLEKDMTLDYGLRLSASLREIATRENLLLRTLLTRDADVHVTGASRARVARDNGADVIFIIHFNSDDAVKDEQGRPRVPHRSSGTLEVRRTLGNINATADEQFIDRVLNRIVPVIPGGHRRDFVVNNTAVASDTNLGNTGAYSPIRAGYCEVEFIDNPTVDATLNGPNGAAVKEAIVNAMRDGIIEDLLVQPAE
jgi:hypothetical protein